MRALLAQADLARYAGQFVWLELNLDSSRNRAFFAEHATPSTPTFFIIDSKSGQVAATQLGAMSVSELTGFLDRGANLASDNAKASADAALSRGDAFLGHKQPMDAAGAYRESLRVAPAAWPRRELAEASLAVALQSSGQYQNCAETAFSEAAHMQRDSMFARTVVAGMWCVDFGDPAPWSKEAARNLEPLAQEALSLSSTVRDHRDELYRTLMILSVDRNDSKAAADWGNRWLAELDAIRPRDDEERAAVDIARVECIQVFGDPTRILPALRADERAMPRNYNASLRVAQMESAAGRYPESVAACDRGLARSPGPDGRAWLLQVKAEALAKEGLKSAARAALEEALRAAQEIPDSSMRQNNIAKIEGSLRQLGQR